MTKHFSKNKAIINYMASGILVLFLGITLAFNQKSIGFKIKVDGTMGNFAKKELKLSKFAMMEINTNYKDIEVKQFDIILARGSRAVQYDEKVRGKNFDLKNYSESAREGDRIVIQILEVSPSIDESVKFSEDRGLEQSDRNIEMPIEKSIITIPIVIDN